MNFLLLLFALQGSLSQASMNRFKEKVPTFAPKVSNLNLSKNALFNGTMNRADALKNITDKFSLTEKPKKSEKTRGIEHISRGSRLLMKSKAPPAKPSKHVPHNKTVPESVPHKGTKSPGSQKSQKLLKGPM